MITLHLTQVKDQGCVPQVLNGMAIVELKMEIFPYYLVTSYFPPMPYSGPDLVQTMTLCSERLVQSTEKPPGGRCSST